ncbi:MAG: hypothetical protein NTW29_09180 [Bacteroidetes bacterium]|nr:hypothetical protein [Bacteroidota bacterium]
MKKLSLFATAFLLVAFTTTQAAGTTIVERTIFSVKASPPAAVLNSFTTIFGNVPVRQWKLRSDGNWRAHFMNNGIAWEATFRPDGTLVKSERN